MFLRFFYLLFFILALLLGCDLNSSHQSNLIKDFYNSLLRSSHESVCFYFDSYFSKSKGAYDIPKYFEDRRIQECSKIIKSIDVTDIEVVDNVSIVRYNYSDIPVGHESGPTKYVNELRLISENNSWKIDGHYFIYTDPIFRVLTTDHNHDNSSIESEAVDGAIILFFKLFDYRADDNIINMIDSNFMRNSILNAQNIMLQAPKSTNDKIKKASFISIVSHEINRENALVKCRFSFPRLNKGHFTGWHYSTMEIKLIYESGKWKIDGHDFFNSNPVYLYNYKNIIPVLPENDK